jgi:hypothetical protein
MQLPDRCPAFPISLALALPLLRSERGAPILRISAPAALAFHDPQPVLRIGGVPLSVAGVLACPVFRVSAVSLLQVPIPLAPTLQNLQISANLTAQVQHELQRLRLPEPFAAEAHDAAGDLAQHGRLALAGSVLPGRAQRREVTLIQGPGAA